FTNKSSKSRKEAIMLRSFMVAALVASTALASANAMAETITPARGTWDSGWFDTQVYIEALKALGHEVAAPLTLDDAVRYQALSQGDADFSVMEWFPLFNERYANFDNLEQVG